MIGYAVSRVVAPEPLYHTLSRGFLRRPAATPAAE
jgi:hypothetical protein